MIYGRYYIASDCHEIVAEQDANKWKVYTAVNGGCEDARRVERFATREKAVARAIDLCREENVDVIGN
jgi:hypothetical protein